MKNTKFYFFITSLIICLSAAGIAFADEDGEGGGFWGGGGYGDDDGGWRRGYRGGEHEGGRFGGGYGGRGYGGGENEGGRYGGRGYGGGENEGGRFGGSGRGLFGQGQKIVQNKLYREECGACHWVFLPRMLPSQSWEKIMGDLENHFGDDASMDEADTQTIKSYLVQNSSRSFWGRAPLRITEMPRIRRKHWGIPKRVLARKDIKTLSNCVACHQGAEYGVFEDD